MSFNLTVAGSMHTCSKNVQVWLHFIFHKFYIKTNPLVAKLETSLLTDSTFSSKNWFQSASTRLNHTHSLNVPTFLLPHLALWQCSQLELSLTSCNQKLTYLGENQRKKRSGKLFSFNFQLRRYFVRTWSLANLRSKKSKSVKWLFWLHQPMAPILIRLFTWWFWPNAEKVIHWSQVINPLFFLEVWTVQALQFPILNSYSLWGSSCSGTAITSCFTQANHVGTSDHSWWTNNDSQAI